MMRKKLEGKLITCILPQGKAKHLIECLFKKDVYRYSLASARGYDVRDSLKKGLLPSEEKDVVYIVLDTAQEAEDLFDYIYYEAGINQPRGGIMYISDLGVHTTFTFNGHEANNGHNG